MIIFSLIFVVFHFYQNITYWKIKQKKTFSLILIITDKIFPFYIEKFPKLLPFFSKINFYCSRFYDFLKESKSTLFIYFKIIFLKILKRNNFSYKIFF